MFGFLYSLFVGGANVAKGIRNSVENEQYKHKYQDNILNTYYDRDMKVRDSNTNELLAYRQDTDTNDLLVVDPKTRKVVKNATLAYAFEYYCQERQKFLDGKTNKTYVKYGNDQHSKDKVVGYRYRDFLTGEMYVARKVNGIECLMNMETGIFVRPTDSELFNTIYCGGTSESLYEKIKIANVEKMNELKKLKDNYALQSEYEKELYSNNKAIYTIELNAERSVYPLKQKEMQNKKRLGLK